MIDPRIDYTDRFDSFSDLAIGIVGAGKIVEQAHLPAYEKAGYDVRGIMDLDQTRAEQLADEYNLVAYEDIEAMLTDNSVDVIDIAVPPNHQCDIVERVVDAGRHVLCQKPLSSDFDEAREIVQMVEDANIVGAVNQQLRWEKSVNTTRHLIDQGQLGKVLRARFDFGILSDWSDYDWLMGSPRLDVLYFSIHYLDAFRYLLGEPERIFATLARTPGRAESGETRSTTVLEFENYTRASLNVNHDSWADKYATFRVDGTEGTIRATIGLFLGIDGNTSKFEFKSREDDDWHTYEIENARFPDAFIGSMGSLLESITSQTTPITSPKDNMKTLQLVNSVYKSMNEKQAIDPSEVKTDYYPNF